MIGWVPGYRARIPVETNDAQVPGALTNWPFYVSGAGFPIGFWDSVAFDDGRDILWTLSDGVTVIKHELVLFDRVGQTMEMHVRLPSVASASPTPAYCYVGNRFATMPSAADQQDVWSNGHEAVYHLEEETAGAVGGDDYADSSGNGNQGLDYASATGQTGQIGAGQQFDGADDYIEMETFQSVFRDDFSLEFWVRPADGQPGSVEIPIGTRDTGNNDVVWVTIELDGKIKFVYESDGDLAKALTNAAVFANGQETWHHVACVADAGVGGVGGLVVYVNGALKALDAVDNGDTSAPLTFADYTSGRELWIGARNNQGVSSHEFAGELDEVRISSAARTADEIEAAFNNQNSPSTFYTVSPVEAMPLSGAYPRRA